MFERFKEAIRTECPLDRECVPDYARWLAAFQEDRGCRRRLRIVQREVGDKMTRRNIIDFFRYQDSGVDMTTKFLSAMIWGYGADPGNRSDNRGPWRVVQMTSDPMLGEALDQAKRYIQEENLTQAYRSFKVHWCGPSFFSKFFYFVGRSLGVARYPLIFDNRVATGLIRMTGCSRDLLKLISVGARLTATAYVQYTSMLHEEAMRLKCEADQIEVFLFDYARP